MTIESVFIKIVEYKLPILIGILLAPWVTYLLSVLIPGRKEEPFLFSVNLWLAIISIILFVGYISYMKNFAGGWAEIVKNTDIYLLIAPPYYIFFSIWLSKKRLPLDKIPAYRSIQGLLIVAVAYLIISWFAGLLHNIVFFSFIPFKYFLILLAVALVIGYFGYRKIVSKKKSV